MWQGTGFHTNGRVVTAWHVINGHAEVRIHTQDNRVYQASLWRQIKHRDIGLVYFNVEIPNIENYRVVDKDPIGEFQTRCAGHWGRTFLSGVPTVSFGMTSMAAISSDLYLSTNIIELGMSGSPLFINNIVIGVASSKTADMSISGGSLFTKLRDQDLR
jgi:S1-C subfamily serine protease